MVNKDVLSHMVKLRLLARIDSGYASVQMRIRLRVKMESPAWCNPPRRGLASVKDRVLNANTRGI